MTDPTPDPTALPLPPEDDDEPVGPVVGAGPDGRPAVLVTPAFVFREYAPRIDHSPREAAAPGGPVRRWNVSPDEPVLEAEQSAVIEKAIGTLPEPFRDVYVLADVEGLPNAEIADILGLSVPAVKSRLHRARLRMRDALAPHFEGGLAP